MTGGHSTGISGLDKLTGSLRPGDSIFWMVDEARRYGELTERLAQACRRSGHALVHIYWRPEDRPRGKRVKGDASFCFDPGKSVEEQLDAFLSFASTHAGKCFIVGIPPAKGPKVYDEFKLMRFLGKVFAQLFWLDCFSYFGFLESQFGGDSLTILHDIPRILVQSHAKGDTTTLRILKAPGRPLADTQIVYALRGDELIPIDLEIRRSPISRVLLNEGRTLSGFWGLTKSWCTLAATRLACHEKNSSRILRPFWLTRAGSELPLPLSPR